jgi:uncharacterized damage-inducible protein DinB
MDLLVELFRHNTMMNQRILEACSPLSTDQLETTATGTYGTIGATLVHIANSQTAYSARLLDTERPDPLAEDPFPGFAALAERMALGDGQLEQAAAAPSEREVEVTGDDPVGTWRMPVSLFLVQAINHGTEHRSQIATVLTQLGVEPPDMDGWTYFDASGRLVPVEQGAASAESVAPPLVTGEVPDDLLAAIKADAQSRNPDADAVTVVRAQGVTWSSGALGCPEPGMMYTQALVPGYWVELDVAGHRMDYRAATAGGFRYCPGGGSPPAVGSTT